MRRLLLPVAALAACVAAGSATAAQSLQSPSLAQLALSPQLIPDSTLPATRARRLLSLGSYWGGRFTTPTGEMVTVYVSDSYPQDSAIAQQWANFLDGLVHGSELGLVTAYIAPLSEVQSVCGADALGCYSPDQSLLVAPGDDPATDTSAAAVVTHEYGHHVAAHRSNAPWPAVDYGTKRWASYLQVCRRTRAGKLFPGAETLPNYTFNPGEAFAETYRVLNQRKAGIQETPWDVVDDSLYPTEKSLALLSEDVTNPWTKPTTTAYRGSLAGRARSRTFTISTGLDGTLAVDLRASAGVRLRLRAATAAGVSAGTRTIAAGKHSTLRTTICGQRSYRLRVTDLRGAGAFTLTVTRP
jgi:hypothetical protein